MKGATPRVAICSLFRNCSSKGSPYYVKKYFARAEKLSYPQNSLFFVAVEGDSTDETWELLKNESSRRPNLVIKKYDQNIPIMPSVAHPARLKSLSASANLAVQTAVNEIGADYVLWLESDLSYPPDMIERLMKWDKDIMAPMIFLKNTKRFYDCWAFRSGDDPTFTVPEREIGCFQPFFPFHPVYDPEHIFKVDTAGSALLIKSDSIKNGAHFTDEEAIVGFCKTAGALGYQTWVDPKTTIWHPAFGLRKTYFKLGNYKPFHERRVMAKIRKEIHIDKTAYSLGKRLMYGRPLEYGWVTQHLIKAKGTKTLDIGCGDSELSAYLAQLGLDVYAVDKFDFADVHKKYMKIFKAEYKFLRADALKLDFPAGYFEQVIGISSIEHEKEDTRLMSECSRLCKPGGKILLTLPYDHYAFWWDSARPQGGQYYYDQSSIFERLIYPIKATLKDFNFLNYTVPFYIGRFSLKYVNLIYSAIKKPYFTHPANAGVILLELENRK